MPIKSAARQYGVPHSTLRDRVKGRIDPETLKPGPAPLLSQEEELNFVDHIKAMASLGYGYTITEVIAMASNYAVCLGKRTPDKPLSTKWFNGFKDRWPDLRVVRPRALSNYRAESTSQTVVDEYFMNLKAVIEDNDLIDKPECIYNIDEKGIQTEHTPPYIVSGNSRTPAITSSRSNVTTIIGCGNALGTQVPPFFVFKGKRFNEDLLNGSTPGSAASMSDSGWSNSSVFLHYMEKHFIKYVQRGDKQQPILVILDGHKTHINVPVLDWAKKNNVIMFILPAHTSHVLQPLDVGCFGPLQKIYNGKCHRYLRENPSTKITRFNVAALASESYHSALSSDNLRSSFKKTGIFPLDSNAISKDNFTPSEPYTTPVKEKKINDENKSNAQGFFQLAEEVIEKKKEFNQNKKKNNTISSIVAGKEITNPDIEKEIREKAKNTEENGKAKAISEVPKSSKKRKSNENQHISSKTFLMNNVKSKSKRLSIHHEPVPGPSHVNLVYDTDSTSDDEMEDDEKCCVCHLFQPKELHNCVSLVFTKWAQCDFEGCCHWVHLKYCCNTTVVRRNDTFICPCHEQNTEE
jgi:hypothetical protein